MLGWFHGLGVYDGSRWVADSWQWSASLAMGYLYIYLDDLGMNDLMNSIPAVICHGHYVMLHPSPCERTDRVERITSDANVFATENYGGGRRGTERAGRRWAKRYLFQHKPLCEAMERGEKMGKSQTAVGVFRSGVSFGGRGGVGLFQQFSTQ